MIEIGNNAFRYCIGLTSVVIGNSVKTIGERAFEYCIGLTSLTIGNSVTAIDKYAFFGYSSLTSITIPNSVTTIGEYAFYGCSGLTSAVIPNSVTKIGWWAFSGCSGLTSVSIGNSVTDIGYDAFSACCGLKDVYCFTECIPRSYPDIFSDVELFSATLHVPAASLEAYSTTVPWSDFGNIVAIGEGDGVEHLASKDFTNPTVYNLDGRRTAKMQKGINLLRNADGRVRKVLRR